MVNSYLPGRKHVKVKLTKRLAVGAVHCSPVSCKGPAKLLHRAASSKVWSSRGKGGCHPLPLRGKISTDEGGLSQSPPDRPIGPKKALYYWYFFRFLAIGFPF